MILKIWGDDTLLFAINNYSRTSAPLPFSLDVTGVQTLYIQTRSYDAGGGAHLFLNDAKLWKEKTNETSFEEALKNNANVLGTDLSGKYYSSLSEKAKTELFKQQEMPSIPNY